MAFWKKSEDPWDRKPGQDWLNKDRPKEPKENPIDSLKQWNEDRKTAAKEKEEAKRLPPEKCPWCGKDMEQGYLITGRDAIHWRPGVYKFTLRSGLLGLSGEAMRVDTQGDFTMYRVTWLCRDCKKLVFDMPEPPEPLEPTDIGDPPWASSERFAERLKAEKKDEEETSEE